MVKSIVFLGNITRSFFISVWSKGVEKRGISIYFRIRHYIHSPVHKLPNNDSSVRKIACVADGLLLVIVKICWMNLISSIHIEFVKQKIPLK